ncbi:MAG: SDR family oxidoreductase, partial [Lysobacteraceae bacterium]
VADTLARFDRLDALINNASAFFPTPIGTATPQQWDALFAANARAPFFLSQAAAPHLRAANGAIVNLVDIHAERPLKDHTLYCMAKAALAMLTLSLAKELGPEVRVNGIAPGAVLWPESGKSAADQQALLARTALQRIGDPQDVADATLFLIRDARYTTGQILRVDGGRLLTI